MSSSPPSYPWYVFQPDGNVDAIRIPARLLRHPEVRRRGLTLTETMKPGAVYATKRSEPPAYVVKILDPGSQELAIYQRLLREPRSSNNHTIPCEIALDEHPLLIMPMAENLPYLRGRNRSSRVLMDVIYQLVEGVEFLHRLHIAHLDISTSNAVAATPHIAAAQKQLVTNRVYIIDFGASMQLDLGPGSQTAITLPETQIEPPDGLRHFDPYSWDIYCAGSALDWLTTSRFQDETVPPHGLIQSYLQWLIGDERGCAGVCHCRPTARTALKVALLLRWAFDAPEGYEWVVDALLHLWSTRE